jgi:hypothetical protein
VWSPFYQPFTSLLPVFSSTSFLWIRVAAEFGFAVRLGPPYLMPFTIQHHNQSDRSQRGRSDEDQYSTFQSLHHASARGCGLGIAKSTTLRPGWKRRQQNRDAGQHNPDPKDFPSLHLPLNGSEDGNEEQQPALLLPKMHKEHKHQASHGNRDQQHSGKHLRAVDRLIGNHKLQSR